MVTWNQATPPPHGVAYEWAGEPHNSESIKYVDGVEVARNLVTNPSFEDPDPLAGVMTSGSTATVVPVTTAHTVHVGSRAIGVVIENASPSQGWIAQDLASLSPSGWVAMSVRARNSTGMARGLRFYFNFYDASGGSLDPSGYVGGSTLESNAEPGDMTVLTVATPIPAGATRARAFLRPREAVTFGRYHTDAWIAAVGATEAEALAQVEDYFDGSFEDDREGDIWVNSSTGAFYSWGGASRGWVSRDDDKANHPLSDNRADARFMLQEAVGSHIPYLYPSPDGASWVLSSYVSRDSRVMRLEFPPGTHSFKRMTSVLWFRPDAGGPWAHPERTGDFKVTPGERVRVKLTASLGGTWTGVDKSAQLEITFRVPSGTEWFMSDVQEVTWGDQGGTVLEHVVTTPSDATGMYVMLRAHPSLATGEPLASSASIFVHDLYIGRDGPSRSGVAEVGVATVARRGLVSETFARSREKIDLQLAEPDERLKGGERIELAAFAASSSEVTWRWRQVTGPEVLLVREGNTCYFQAPDVDNPTDMRIAVSASSVDGSNRSDWHFFDLEILPTVGRFAAEESGDFLPYTPQMVGYNRGKREIWNDVIAPVGMDPEGRKEPKLVDLGIPADDVTFSLDGEEPARASAGAVYVDIRDGAIYRNFGGGYNEADDTTGAPRQNAYMVNPATGEVFEWIEEADDGR